MIYFFYILASSFWCLGVFASTTPDMWLENFSVFIESNMPFLGKPIVTCVTCMSSLHTVIVMLIGHFLIGVEFQSFKQAFGIYLLAVPAVAFLNTILWTLLNKVIGKPD